MKGFCLVPVCLFFLLAIASCSSPAPQTGGKNDAAEPHENPAHSAGPHGGTVADWGGGKYHIEFVVDHAKKEATVYILGSDEKTPTPVKASKLLLSINEPLFQVDLAPRPLAGEAEGMSSCFVGQHANLGKVQEFAGTISAEVEGVPYAGDFKEEAEGRSHKH